MSPWQLAGLDTENGQALDRPIATGTVLIPSCVAQQGQRLCWGATFEHPPVERRVGPRWLESFTALADASDVAIVEYAREHGVLGLCAHSLPWTHNPPGDEKAAMAIADGTRGAPTAGRGRGSSVPPALRRWLAVQIARGCRPQAVEDSERFTAWEPLAQWRRWARQARALLNVAASLHQDKPGPAEDWSTIFTNGPRRAPWWKQTTAGDRIILAHVLNEWMVLANVRPLITWSIGRPPEVVFSSGAGHATLFGTLACQLVFAAARSDGMAVCSSCGGMYTPTRRPRGDQRRYCPTCRRRGVPLRDAQRDCRRRDPRGTSGDDVPRRGRGRRS